MGSKHTVKQEILSRSFEGRHYEAKVSVVTRVRDGVFEVQELLKHEISFILA